jgi:hypothetical protein
MDQAFNVLERILRGTITFPSMENTNMLTCKILRWGINA